MSSEIFSGNKRGQSDPRIIAATVLAKVDKQLGWAEEVLDGALKKHPAIDPRDRALATELVYGVLRNRYRLDQFILAASSRKLKNIDPPALTTLRIGTYQLLYLDRIPASAAVSEAVNMVRTLKAGHASGFVNAILRKIANGEATPAKPKDAAGQLALDYSIPLWLARYLLGSFSKKGATLIARQSTTPPPLFMRVDTSRIEMDRALETFAPGVERGQGRYAPEGLWALRTGDPRKLALLKNTQAVVQGQASQMVSHIVAPKPGFRVLDACAAPGLKTTHMAQMMEDTGEIVALDIHPHRVQTITEMAKKLGFSCIKAVEADAALYRDEQLFNAVLVDAPCSGLGVLSHNPERKWRMSKRDIAGLVEVQKAILANVAKLVKSGGLLVYATCTVTAEENDEVIEQFLADNTQFGLEPIEHDGWPIDATGQLRSYPHNDKGDPSNHLDGFFAARLRKG